MYSAHCMYNAYCMYSAYWNDGQAPGALSHDDCARMKSGLAKT